MKNILKTTVTAGLILMLGGLTLTGCESDSVAPQDETPALNQENAASQAAMVALAIVEVGPQLVNFTPTPSKTVYTYDFTGYDYVEGEVAMDFRLGGADGASSTPDEADYARLYTLGETGLTITYEGMPGSAMYLTADIMGDLDQQAGTATILADSGGILVAGVYTGAYTIDGLVVAGTGYPSAGTVTFTGGEHTLVVTFDGSSTALVSVDGENVFSLNLADGELTPIS